MPPWSTRPAASCASHAVRPCHPSVALTGTQRCPSTPCASSWPISRPAAPWSASASRSRPCSRSPRSTPACSPSKGPAVLFENVEGFAMPVLTNLFGTVERVAWGMNREPHQLQELGETLAFFKQPVPPESFGQALELLPLVKVALSMKPKIGRPRALPGGRAARGRHRSRPAADPDLLARRAGAADHLAAGGDQGAVRRARGQVQPRHLPHAGAGPRPDADALAQASRRRAAPPPLGPEPQATPCPPRP